jgi:hypothetical protein
MERSFGTALAPHTLAMSEMKAPVGLFFLAQKVFVSTELQN